MTAKRFINDAYTREFTASITELIPKGDHYIAILDHTYFYPEGGGQPSDTGTIAGVPVVDVQYDGEAIHHILSAKPDTLEDALCQIDWDRRFDLMQQHTGQHILSGAFERLFDANTIGFHLSDTYVTVDLDKKLSLDQAVQAEIESNETILSNLEVLVHYPDENALAAMPLRKQPKVTKDIRVIEIDGFDFSPCGGTHVMRTGEIGIIKIKKIENHKKGIRVEFICGKRALEDYRLKNQILYTLAGDLSIKPEETLEAYEKLKEELSQAKKNIKTLSEEVVEYRIQALSDSAEEVGGHRLIVQTLTDIDMRGLKKISATLAAEPKTIALLALVSGDVKLLFSRSEDADVSMKEIIKDSLECIEGRGGGSPTSAQGGGSKPEKAPEALELARQAIINQLS